MELLSIQWNFDHMDSVFNRRGGFFNSGPYVARYRCYPVSFLGKDTMEQGNKISMPPSALNELASRNISWPMMFELRNESKGRTTHAGVLEFVSEEGMCHIPYWVSFTQLFACSHHASSLVFALAIMSRSPIFDKSYRRFDHVILDI